MLAFRNILLIAALAAAASLVQRDYATAQADLRALANASDSVATAARKVNSSDKQTGGASFQAGVQLYQNFSRSTADLNGTVLTAAQAGVFFQGLTAMLYPKLRTALGEVVAARKNYDPFISALQTVVLNRTSSSVTQYGGAVVTAVPSAARASASEISSSFSSLVSSALAAFQAK